MKREEFVAAWARRRRRQVFLSGTAAVFLLALVAISGAGSSGANVLRMTFPPIIIVIAVASLFNARCPSCGRFLGSWIFLSPRCRRCGGGSEQAG
ncbi:MAG TPA: hypothetical protein VF765_35640 [Polyangiaceae bacterium]